MDVSAMPLAGFSITILFFQRPSTAGSVQPLSSIEDMKQELIFGAFFRQSTFQGAS
jgi:hypothetical protein